MPFHPLQFSFHSPRNGARKVILVVDRDKCGIVGQGETDAGNGSSFYSLRGVTTGLA
ncbi:MAG TPA: hypothetical protein VFJ58_18395 [Armatimonadota bacterium]|nr:hypothetical protein [Armatimonadota bacterium]